jgi:hypothetical protein
MSRPLNPWKLSGYKAGQNVVCKVSHPEPGGYAVTIPKDNLPGFLPTQAHLKTGEEILAQFVCVHNNRILLSARFSGEAQNAQPGKVEQVNWEDQLAELGSPSGQYQAYQAANAGPGGRAGPAAGQVPQSGPSQQKESEMAFQVWADQAVPQTPTVHLKRAVDLILPPLQTEAIKQFRIADYDLEWLITDLEGGMRTCCVKLSNNNVPSRAAILLYRGRAVGCIYCSKKQPEPTRTEDDLQKALFDLSLPDTTVSMYDLPESLILSSSALFLGYPVPREDDYDARAYMDYICEWFEGKGNTACLAFSFPANNGHCFVYVHRGQFVGAFYVEEQAFTQDKDYVYKLLERSPNASLNVSILPPEMTSSAVRFGFSLSMARKPGT